MPRRGNAPLVQSARLDSRAAAEYYVLFRLAQMGFLASPATSPGAELVACSPRGTRVALLQVRVRDARGRFRVERAERVARNRAFVFVDLPERPGDEPVCFVVPASVAATAVEREPAWPAGPRAAGELAAFREAWHLLGLTRPHDALSSPATVTSPSSPAA